MRTSPVVLGLGIGLCLSSLSFGAGDEGKAKSAEDPRKPGTVLTFYGLLQLERNPDLTDAEKIKEWEAFIARSKKQVGYAEKAIDHWKNAARLRLVALAESMDTDKALLPRDKLEAWERVIKEYANSKEARHARVRIRHWRGEETKRLVAYANEVEKARRPKVERIAAWKSVLDWVDQGPEAKAAKSRIAQLQTKLYEEALSVDKIDRIGSRIKLEAWQDVLGGAPSRVQRAEAEARVRSLKAKLVGPQAASNP